MTNQDLTMTDQDLYDCAKRWYQEHRNREKLCLERDRILKECSNLDNILIAAANDLRRNVNGSGMAFEIDGKIIIIDPKPSETIRICPVIRGK